MAKLSVTPPGTAVFPHLREADEYEGKRNYKVTIKLPADCPSTQQLIDKLEAIRDKYWATDDEVKKKFNVKQRAAMKPHPVFREETDDEGNETGYLLFSASCAEGFQDKRTGKFVSLAPQIVDAKRKPLPDDIDVWGGSTLKIAYAPFCWARGNPIWAYGVKMRLRAVQVIELRSGGGASSAFDVEEGFEAEDAPAPSRSASEEVFDPSADDNDDF